MHKKRFASKPMWMIIIIGVIIIPLLYSFFYLDAFWDPYSRLDTLPVAVVNEDSGAFINGELRNLGSEMCDKLTEDAKLKYIFTDEQDARKGTQDSKYYAAITIPSDFSEDIASASDTDKKTAELTFSPNEKRNFLASQILSKAVLEMETSVRESVTSEIVNQLSDQLKSVPDQLNTLQDGFVALNDGSEKVNSGAQEMKDATLMYSDQFGAFKAGITKADSGVKDLKSGADRLDQGIQSLLLGINQLNAKTQNIDALTQGTANLASGALVLQTNLDAYVNGVDTLISNVSDTSAFMQNYVVQNPELLKDPTFAGFLAKIADPQNVQKLKTLKSANEQLRSASAQIAQGAKSISDNTKSLPELKVAIGQLKQGLQEAKNGSQALKEGSLSLNSGVSALSDASSKLQNASIQIASGAGNLQSGTSALNDGISAAKDKVGQSVNDANSKVAALDGLPDFASQSVSIKQDSLYPVPNYGTAFAPYFLSLSLWVGAIIIFFGIFLDVDGRFSILSRNSNRKLLRSFLYLLIGLVQAIVLAVVIKVGLGLQVENISLYYLSCCLVSVVFISIVQFLMAFLKDAGKFLAIVLLILQLTSCGGTFPMETVPKIFNWLYPFMPMTYSVGLFKEAISGVYGPIAWQNILILFGILLLFMALTIVMSVIKKNSVNQVKLFEQKGGIING